MKIRRDTAFISGILFTVALLCLIPMSWRATAASHDRAALASLDAGFQVAAHIRSDFGISSLAVILIGLIVTWMGYVKAVRWTWFVMFVIVWVWAFPILVMPLFQYTIAIALSEWVVRAIKERGSARSWAESVLIFGSLLTALILPLRSFFLRTKTVGSSVGSNTQRDDKAI